jgi:hypothetical protein
VSTHHWVTDLSFCVCCCVSAANPRGASVTQSASFSPMPHGWMLFTDKTDWWTASERCQKIPGVDGSNLASLMVLSDNDNLAKWMNDKSVDGAWIGLTTDCPSQPSVSNEKVYSDKSCWYWLQGTDRNQPSYDAWAPTYPSTAWGKCGSLTAASKKWQNNNCEGGWSWSRAFVCDIPY